MRTIGALVALAAPCRGGGASWMASVSQYHRTNQASGHPHRPSLCRVVGVEHADSCRCHHPCSVCLVRSRDDQARAGSSTDPTQFSYPVYRVNAETPRRTGPGGELLLPVPQRRHPSGVRLRLAITEVPIPRMRRLRRAATAMSSCSTRSPERSGASTTSRATTTARNGPALATSTT